LAKLIYQSHQRHWTISYPIDGGTVSLLLSPTLIPEENKRGIQ